MSKTGLRKTIHTCLAIACLCAVNILPVKASEEYQTGDQSPDVPVSDGKNYEVTIVDQNGNLQKVKQSEVNPEEIEEQRKAQADAFDVVLKLGNEEEVIGTYDNQEEADAKANMRNHMRSTGTAEVRAVNDYSNIKYGVVDFHTKTSAYNTSYTETQTNAKGYLNGSYAADGAFLGYCSTDKSKIKFRQAGVEGCVNANEVIVRDYEDESVVKSINSYMVEDGKIYHYYTLDVTKKAYYATNIGPAQSYMKNNAVYFSYDGHYFYTSYEKMIDDYKANTYKNSINPNQPYYNYFQFITQRTKTKITANQLNAYINQKISGQSIMKNMGQYFISNQNKYGANALLMFAVASNESAYGTSSIALAKNNLFGHNATDTDPGGNADRYSSPQASIEVHAKDFVSRDYMDPKDYGGKYHGGHLGDKASGMNVSYASDSYWGEKAAAIAWAVNNANGNVDFNQYQIGIIDKMTNLHVRSEATSGSNSLYQTGNWSNYPVMILAQKSGQSVGGNSVWYKMQTDPTLNANRTAMTQDVCVYDYDKYYGYVSAYYVTPVTYTNASNQIPGDQTKPSEMAGDVNGDGAVTASDYVLIKNHIMGRTQLSSQQLRNADYNKDGAVTASDYVLIKRFIMGR